MSGSITIDFDSLFTQVGKLDKLSSLGLRGFKTVPLQLWTLKNLSQIEDLSLNSDNLTEVPTQLLSLTNLKNLNLVDNSLMVLNEPNNDLNLNYLNLSGNQIKEFPLDFIKSTKVSSVDLSRNKLVSIPPTIKELKGLTSLNLSDNPLESLPAEIRDLKNLKNLQLNNVKVSIPSKSP